MAFLGNSYIVKIHCFSFGNWRVRIEETLIYGELDTFCNFSQSQFLLSSGKFKISSLFAYFYKSQGYLHEIEQSSYETRTSPDKSGSSSEQRSPTSAEEHPPH